VRASLAALAGLTLLVTDPASAEKPALAGTLLDNVNGVTLDAAGATLRFTGMVIDREGRVVRLLAQGEQRPKDVEARINGLGRVALPGLIDSNLRLADLGFAALGLDLGGTRSLREVQLKLGAYALANRDSPWIIGTGWDNLLWDRREMPEAADLDAVIANRPVWLISADGRTGWGNSLALRLAGVTSRTPDPAGGIVGHLAPSLPTAPITTTPSGGFGGSAPAPLPEAGGLRTAQNPSPLPPEPSGIMLGTARELVERVITPPRGIDRDRALDLAQALLLSRGITAVADVGTTMADWQAYRRAGDLGRLGLRIIAYADSVATLDTIGGPGPSPWLYNDRLHLGGVVLRLDGPLVQRRALLKAPYSDPPYLNGASLVDDESFRRSLRRAAGALYQVAIDANGDAAVSRVLDTIEAVTGKQPGDRRWRIHQATLIDPADFTRAARAGVAVIAAPARLPAEWQTIESGLGPGRLGGALAWKSLADSGATLAFSASSPGLGPQPFAGMAAAITRASPEGQPFGGWQPTQRLTREAALAAYTAGGAWAAFAGARFGQLAPGQWADFILVDRDPLLASPEELRAMQVSETWVAGKKVYRAPEAPLAIPRRPDDEDGRR